LGILCYLYKMNIWRVLTWINILSYIHAYKMSHTIITKLKSKDNIKQVLLSEEFYMTYFQKVDAENISFLSEPNRHIISYDARPNLPFIPESFPKIRVDQIWNHHTNGNVSGEIKTKYICCNLWVDCFCQNHKCGMNIDAEITYKKYALIPNKSLDKMVREFCDIFMEFCDEICL
jgi:hypothetical protein